MRAKLLSLGRVVLMGIAQRSVHLKYSAIIANLKWRKMLKINTKTVGDWLKIKRIEKKSHTQPRGGKNGYCNSFSPFMGRRHQNARKPTVVGFVVCIGIQF
jgi:hypothetical protein